MDFFIFVDSSIQVFVIIKQIFEASFLQITELYDIEGNFAFVKQNKVPVFCTQPQQGYLADPRKTSCGYWAIENSNLVQQSLQHSLASYNYHRIANTICEGGSDMISQKAIILEYALDSLNAISFTKGCYPGQELMARTKHRGQVRKFPLTAPNIETYAFGDEIPLDVFTILLKNPNQTSQQSGKNFGGSWIGNWIGGAQNNLPKQSEANFSITKLSHEGDICLVLVKSFG